MSSEQSIREYLLWINDNLVEISQSFRDDMRVPARVFANRAIIEDILRDRSLEQLVNVATLPGIQKYAYAMPDIHQGYGFPIGGVAAMAIDEGGVISPGGIGYDINCGVRLMAASMTADELQPYAQELATALYKAVPSGVGQGGNIVLEAADMDAVLHYGARYMVERGYGTEDDLLFCEEEGCMPGGDASAIFRQAKERGKDQLGTLGSGNHFLEVQKVDEIYDARVAEVFGLQKDMVTIMIHCGSRGLGHQTCTDHVRLMMRDMHQWNIQLPDRELVCAPFTSPHAQAYFTAMVCAANFAWANRHIIGHSVRQAWRQILGRHIQVKTIYDVSHNIGKREHYIINGVRKQVIMHRKGATRAFGPNSEEIPLAYRAVGQPVLIPGTMGTASYVLVGNKEGADIAFSSSCHGAGRRMSRAQAKTQISGSQLRKELETKNIIIRCDSNAGLAEEGPLAYKDVEEVVSIVHAAGLARKVARLVPLIVVKGG